VKDRSILPLKLFFFIHFFSLGLYGPYLNLYFKGLGLSGAQIGLLTSLARLTSAMAPLFWGPVVDSIMRTRAVLAVAIGMSIMAFSSFALPLRFGLLILSMILFSFFNSPISPVANSITLQYLDEKGGGSYGGIRAWGSVGFIIASLSLGEAIRTYTLRAMFYGYATSGIANIALSWGLPQASPQMGGKLKAGVWRLLRSPNLAVLLFCGLLGQISSASYYMFFSIYLDSLNLQGRYIGLAWGVGVASEVLVMLFSGRVAKRIGPKLLFSLGLFGAALRWYLYTATDHPALILLFQIFHGLTFGAFYVAGVTLVDMEVPSSRRASGQSIFTASTFGLGGVIGSLAGGPLYDRLGVSALFQLSAGVALTAGILFSLLFRERKSLIGV
jgi:PPP family 3-phenylpropionic acid transporter